MANILKMGAEGKLLVAGPFTDDGNLRGLYVFRVALRLSLDDPEPEGSRKRNVGIGAPKPAGVSEKSADGTCEHYLSLETTLLRLRKALSFFIGHTSGNVQ